MEAQRIEPGAAEIGIEGRAFLSMAGKLRHAVTEREAAVHPYLKRYDRARADHRMRPAKRVEAAAEFLRASYRADHAFEETLEDALDEYRRAMHGQRVQAESVPQRTLGSCTVLR